jgi:hypothetical protein
MPASAPFSQAPTAAERHARAAGHVTTKSEPTAPRSAPGTQQRLTAGRRALIWPIHRVASVPAIIGIHGTIASVPWKFQPVAKCFDISYCEISRLARGGSLLYIATSSADLRFSRLAERSISPHETASGLCDRLIYADRHAC